MEKCPSRLAAGLCISRELLEIIQLSSIYSVNSTGHISITGDSELEVLEVTEVDI